MERVQEKYILKDLDKKIVLLVGQRQTGKTWLANKVLKAESFLKNLFI